MKVICIVIHDGKILDDLGPSESMHKPVDEGATSVARTKANILA